MGIFFDHKRYLCRLQNTDCRGHDLQNLRKTARSPSTVTVRLPDTSTGRHRLPCAGTVRKTRKHPQCEEEAIPPPPMSSSLLKRQSRGLGRGRGSGEPISPPQRQHQHTQQVSLGMHIERCVQMHQTIPNYGHHRGSDMHIESFVRCVKNRTPCVPPMTTSHFRNNFSLSKVKERSE